MNRLWYALHKWISAAAFLQLGVWTITGCIFAWTAQERLKSAPVERAHEAPLPSAAVAPIAEVLAASAGVTGAAQRVELRGTPSGAFFLVTGSSGTARIEAISGALRPVDRGEAEAIARRDQPSAPAVRETTRIEASPPIEYRDCEGGECALPVYRVALADAAGTVVYVDATTGDVRARRNDVWRMYDFAWSLHIMDYRGREDFNHWLIRGASLIALATVLSGVVLLGIKVVRWVRVRLGRPPRHAKA
jgi:uncharacterized iron-regulated membrane protein